MSKYSLSPDDLAKISQTQNFDRVIQYLKRRETLNFNVGDFLVKMNRRMDENGLEVWNTEKISSVSEVPKHFLCVHEDQWGVKYIRQLTAKGEPFPYVVALTELEDYTRYVVDPEFADHLILGDGEKEYDFSEAKRKEKSRRDKITNMNKKIAHRNINPDQINEILSKLKPGDKLWIGYNIPQTAEEKPYTVISTEFKAKHTAHWTEYKNTWVVTMSNESQYKREMCTEEFDRAVFFTTEPYKYETI